MGAGNIFSVPRARDSVPMHREIAFVGILESCATLLFAGHDQASSRSSGCSSGSSPHAVHSARVLSVAMPDFDTGQCWKRLFANNNLVNFAGCFDVPACLGDNNCLRNYA